jgi:RNA polymerase sigma factor (sigma-70 family)
MATIKTSISLLKAIANDTATVRWTEFFIKYEPVMRSYLTAHYPSLDHDDIIQETMRSLVDKLPDYRYTPDKNGHFGAYLIGIVKHKALDQLRKQKRASEISRRAAEEVPDAPDADKNTEEEAWRERAVDAAIEQLLADSSINPRHREIFRHVALLHEPPEDVASRYGVTRGNVDVIKKRMIEKLSRIVSAMTAVD